MQDASKQDGDQDRSLAAAWLGANLEAGELERAKGGDQRDVNGIAAASNDHATAAGSRGWVSGHDLPAEQPQGEPRGECHDRQLGVDPE